MGYSGRFFERGQAHFLLLKKGGHTLFMVLKKGERLILVLKEGDTHTWFLKKGAKYFFSFLKKGTSSLLRPTLFSLLGFEDVDTFFLF